MQNTFTKSISVVALSFSFITIACTEKSEKQIASQEQIETTPEWTAEESEVKNTVERFLINAGNSDLSAMDAMISDKANICISRYIDGQWQSVVITIAEYFADAKNHSPIPFYEPINKWEILINENQLAFVKADATVYNFGIALKHNIDYFTLIRENSVWQFINLSYTTTPLPEEKKNYDIEAFAKSYAQAWSGVRPEFVAQYFAEDGVLRVNEDTPANGRTEIAKVAQGFMTDLPDMTVRYDSLITKPDGIEFHWTLIATNTGPGGTGNKVNVSGYERWQMTENGLIKNSQGVFPSEEYQRQIEGGIKK